MNTQASRDFDPAQLADLRRRAEDRLRANEASPAEVASVTDARALVHELQVHQIELEMQNEELQRARVEAEEASEKYLDLFDFAPVGYFLWDHEGRILELNLAGAALLGLERSSVVGKRLSQFMIRTDQATFAEFCQRVVQVDTKSFCELKLQPAGRAVDVLIEGRAVFTRDGQTPLCRAAVIDLTQQKRADELAAANQALEVEMAARRGAEEALRSVAQFPDENPYPVLRIDRAGAVLYANRASIALRGEWRCEVGRPAPEFFARLTRETVNNGQPSKWTWRPEGGSSPSS
ncbi:MAG: PAS domain-containing protein [Pirellulaceae bacterium]